MNNIPRYIRQISPPKPWAPFAALGYSLLKTSVNTALDLVYHFQVQNNVLKVESEKSSNNHLILFRLHQRDIKWPDV